MGGLAQHRKLELESDWSIGYNTETHDSINDETKND
jgi:hypothetical protein